MDKAFTNHKYNGVLLKFPNGATISTIWGPGSYSEHHDDEFEGYSTLNKNGSMTAEIMILEAPQRVVKRIFKRLAPDSQDTVIGWVTITDWLWVINQLAKAEGGN